VKWGGFLRGRKHLVVEEGGVTAVFKFIKAAKRKGTICSRCPQEIRQEEMDLNLVRKIGR